MSAPHVIAKWMRELSSSRAPAVARLNSGAVPGAESSATHTRARAADSRVRNFFILGILGIPRKMAEITTIKLSKKTKERLAKLGRKGETYEEIIKKMLNSYASVLHEKELEEEIKKAAEFAERDEVKGAELVAELSNALIKVVPKGALVDRREEERRLMKMLSWR